MAGRLNAGRRKILVAALLITLPLQAHTSSAAPLPSKENIDSEILHKLETIGQHVSINYQGGAMLSLATGGFSSAATLAKPWYQFALPFSEGHNPDLAHGHVEFNAGKMDPFLFFDQNAIVGDETHGFINQSFVHNPLLNTDNDAGLDAFGFTPGIHLAYVDEANAPITYGISVGIFSASDDANLKSPLVVVQAETTQRFFGGLGGHYRLYIWNNGQGVDIDGTIRPHKGIGLSVDQQVGDDISLFGRYGYQIQGNVKFNQTVTVGAEFSGTSWLRSGDTLGVALGWLNSSNKFRQASTANGPEQLVEIFYRYQFNKFITISPDFQYIRNPGGDKTSSAFAAYGLRTQIHF